MPGAGRATAGRGLGRTRGGRGIAGRGQSVFAHGRASGEDGRHGHHDRARRNRDGEPGATEPPTPRPESIGRYRIVGELDSGGQALVYRAVHPTLPRDLAIKIAHQPSSIDRSLLKGDAEILCLLDHPNLVRVHDLDVHEGRPFVVMEFVRGTQSPAGCRPIAAVTPPGGCLDRRDCSGSGVRSSLRSCPSGYQAQEHLDRRVGPAAADRFRRGPMAARLDRQSGWPVGRHTGLHGPGAGARRVGTCRSALSDIFGLGGVLYFLLTGQAPFEGATRNDQWRRASRCDFDRAALHAKKVPRGLERIVLKAMAADPKDRFASADEMATALDGFLHRPRRLAIQAGALLLAAAAVVVWSSWRREGPVSNTTKASASDAGPSSPKPLRIESLQVALHPVVKGDPSGTIGTEVFAGRFQQDARIQARLSAGVLLLDRAES